MPKQQYSTQHDFANTTSNHSWNWRQFNKFALILKIPPYFPSPSSTFTGLWPTKVTLSPSSLQESLQNQKFSNLAVTSSQEQTPPIVQKSNWPSVPPLHFCPKLRAAPHFPNFSGSGPGLSRDEGKAPTSSTCHLSPPYLSHSLMCLLVFIFILFPLHILLWRERAQKIWTPSVFPSLHPLQQVLLPAGRKAPTRPHLSLPRLLDWLFQNSIFSIWSILHFGLWI